MLSECLLIERTAVFWKSEAYRPLFPLKYKFDERTLCSYMYQSTWLGFSWEDRATTDTQTINFEQELEGSACCL